MLEITETALLRATPSTIATLDGVRALGVRTVIDDFGTGYFSLSHLRQFPIDTLKIASEFVQDTDATSKSSALAGAIVAMGRSLGIETVAEGIETERAGRADARAGNDLDGRARGGSSRRPVGGRRRWRRCGHERPGDPRTTPVAGLQERRGPSGRDEESASDGR